jgi:hypothetical protein
MSLAELLIACRWSLAIVLIMAGPAKLSVKGRESTREALGNYRVLPPSLRGPAAVVLPVTEIVLACLLFADLAVTVAAGCAAALLGTFAVLVGWHVSQGRRFACGCRRSGRISWELAGRDAVLSGLAILVVVGPKSGLMIGAEPGWHRTSSQMSALLPMPLLAVLAVMAIRLLGEATSVLRTSAGSKSGKQL